MSSSKSRPSACSGRITECCSPYLIGYLPELILKGRRGREREGVGEGKGKWGGEGRREKREEGEGAPERRAAREGVHRGWT
jgi:hypothetical protein